MGLEIRPLREEEVPAIQEIFLDAFAAFAKVPRQLVGDANYARPRFLSYPEGAFAAEYNGALVGACFAANWGSVAPCGPVVIKPKTLAPGAGKGLVEAVTAAAEGWGARLFAGYTFASSRQHLEFFQGLGFWPHYLATRLATPIRPSGRSWRPEWVRFSEASAEQRPRLLAGAAELTGAIFEGLELTLEIQATLRHGFGDTLFLLEEGRVAGLAVCHLGSGTEAGRNSAYLRFGAVPSGPEAPRRLDALIDACEALAAAKAATRLSLGISTARRNAYQQLLARRYQIVEVGITLTRPAVDAYSVADVYALDEWR